MRRNNKFAENEAYAFLENHIADIKGVE